jgi:hypothetical protein
MSNKYADKISVIAGSVVITEQVMLKSVEDWNEFNEAMDAVGEIAFPDTEAVKPVERELPGTLLGKELVFGRWAPKEMQELERMVNAMPPGRIQCIPTRKHPNCAGVIE